ncbi:GntR family transcriptional regulator [Frankia canadensis]|uniref:GntR family transcriptional regulator n=1 Tax=Frankia canadensis TaxID=1836972 RepID=A0A2I2KJJ9_9ACTN|nr:FCD domain-containing protein [Frankia canadensis]SNQ45826.1 GntR family transcriptional regulator [Frankia canadensis]SOU53116.1 GntR family transcriptional regulator [Frankia canadensis]
MEGDVTTDARAPLIRHRSNAELVANHLRHSIVRGELPDGSALPTLEHLRRRFGVGLPATREALRILESEGLVTVLRGNTGGSVVHAPSLSGAASRLGMVLRSQQVDLTDLAGALRAIEPVCAQLCAEQSDEATVGELTELIEQTRAATADEHTAIALNRRFHETLAERCGNRTLQALVGTLELLWSGQEEDWAHNLPSKYTMENRLAGIAAHERVLDRIRAGDGPGAYLAMGEHIAEGYTYVVPDEGAAGGAGA